MYISKINLKNFRNYIEQSVDFSEGVNIVYGRNAQGKTNLIESIFLCSSGRSHRTTRDQELVREDSGAYFVEIIGYRKEIPFKISIFFDKNGKKNIKINDLSIKKFGELMGVLNTVIFSPEDLQIIKRGPAERRRFLDILISQTYPTYFYKLQTYMRIIKQKNALLKKISNRSVNNDLLAVFNKKQAEAGAEIIRERQKFLEEIKQKLLENHKKLTNDSETLEISYISSAGNKAGNEEKYFNFLENNKTKEIKTGNCIYGPHRDDLDFMINGKDLKTFGSQGQQRTAVLALKLTEIEIIREMTGYSPVLLLDDVMSELDLSRKRHLLNNINTRQALITGTEKRTYAAFEENTSFYYVIDGTITERK